MGRSLHIRLHAYAPDGTSLGMLPRPLGVDADFQHNDAGTLKVTYSRLALGGSILQRGLEQGLAIGFEVSDGGEWIEPYNARFVLTSRSRDAKDRSDTVTLNLMTYTWLLKKALLIDTSKLLADGDNKGKRPFYSANPGTIVKTMLDENRERGGVAQYVTAGFDTGKDSSGAAWSNVMTLYYDPGVDTFTALSNLAANGVCDWRTRGMTLHLWNADSAALCHDLSGGIVIPLATQALESPEEETIEDLASHILVMGDGIDFTQDNAAAPTPWGKWELYSSQGGVSDEGTARLLMQSQLDQAARVRGQYTRSVLVTDVDALPLIDYAPGDWITAPTVSHGEKVRVQRVTISLSNQGLKAALILNDRLYDAQTRTAKRIQGITGGAVAGGAQGGRPAPAQDHRVPKAPEGLTLASDAYLDSTGHARGLVSAVWGEVSQATDNTAIEIADYRVEWRYSDSDADAWMSAGVTSDERLSWSGLDCGRTVVVRVRAIPTYSDKPGEWSAEKSVTVASDVTPPAVPSAPRLSSETGVVTISWDGLPATGTGMDADFDHCEVGRGLTSGSLAVVSASMTGRTQWVDTDVLPGAVWTYALRAVDHAGNKSAWSKTAQIEVVGAVSQEQIEQIQSDLAENEKTLDQAKKDIQANQTAINQTQKDIAANEAAVSQAQKDIAANKAALDQAQQDIAANEAAVSQAQKDVTATKATVDKVNSDLTTVKSDVSATKNTLSGVQSTLSQTQKDLDAAEQNISANTSKIAQAQSAASSAASKAQQAYDTATSAKKTADGLHNIFKGWQDPTTIEGTVVKTGDFWYRTQQYWTTSQGEPDNSPSLLANFYTYAEGEPDNSPSVLVPLESEVVEVLTWDGQQWNQFNLVASNVIASGSIVGDLIAANTITGDLIAAGTITGDLIAGKTITGDLIAANTINATHLTANSVTSEKIAANAVIAGKIAANAVTTGKLDALAVTADKLAANAVTADKIAANAVTTGKLNALAVTAEKIAAGAVNADKLAANAVTAGKIAANAVTAGTIAAGAVTTDKLAALSVTAAKIAALTITGDKIAANAISADKITSNAVTADKLAANSVNASKIVSGAITADKLAANSVTAVKIAAGSITSDKIKAGQFSGYTFTGAIYQSSTAADTGFKLRDSGLDMWDSEHNHTVHLDGNGETNVVTGRFKTAFDGARIEFSTATVDDPQMGEIYTGAIDFHDSEGLVGQLYATSSGSGIGLIKIQPAGSQIAQMTVQRYSSSLTSEVGTTISANDGTGKTASVGANVLPTPSIAMTGALGKNGTFSWFQWKALDAGFGVNSYAHGTVNAMPLRYGRYYAWANADCSLAGVVAHVENTGGTSGWGVMFFNCDVSAAGGAIWCMTMGINAS